MAAQPCPTCGRLPEPDDNLCVGIEPNRADPWTAETLGEAIAAGLTEGTTVTVEHACFAGFTPEDAAHFADTGFSEEVEHVVYGHWVGA